MKLRDNHRGRIRMAAYRGRVKVNPRNIDSNISDAHVNAGRDD